VKAENTAMNAPHPLQHQFATASPIAPFPSDDDEINFAEYWDIIVDHRWMIALLAVVAALAAGAYGLLARPVYEANLLIQVEDSAASAKSFLGEAASLFDVKTPATAEIEILRSRMVIGQTVSKTLLFIDAQPRYLPVFGNWLSRGAKDLSTPINGWVHGKERIEVADFSVPAEFEGTRFRLTAEGDGKFSLTHPEMEQRIHGVVGTSVTASIPEGTINLTVTRLDGLPGAEFNLTRNAEDDVVEQLQDILKVAEKGRQSGVIEVGLQDPDRAKLTRVLNEIGRQYVNQNVTRKAAEAQKTLEFLDVQLPQFKKQLEQSEDAYSHYRNREGTVSLDEEAKLMLAQTVDLQTKLMEAEQKRRELVVRFTPEHPTVKVLDEQIRAWHREIENLNGRVKGLPNIQQEAFRLQRDVKVNNELYEQLRNNTVQLQLIREGKIGNVRLIDSAVMPREPVKPKRSLLLLLATVGGALAGVVVAFVRTSFARAVSSPQEIEMRTGLNVYSTIPLSDTESAMAKKVKTKLPGIHLLASTSPHDAAVESLRSLRAALLNSLSEQYDLILIDSAPVLAAADTLSIASHAGTVLLVARFQLTQLGELQESTRRLVQAGSSVAGVLFNALDVTRRHYGNYGYRYGGYRYGQYEYQPVSMK
jgi:tyrosine-protein kinase Etk/Wzc